MKRININASTIVKTAYALALLALLIVQTRAQAPAPAAPIANPPAAATAPPATVAATNTAVTDTNLDARRKALLQSITNRTPRVNATVPAFPSLPAPPAAATAAPAPRVNPPANVAGQTAQPAPGNPGTVLSPLPTTSGVDQTDRGEFSLKFYNAPVDQIFEKYSEISGRTVLRPAALPAAAVTIITATPLTRTEAVQALDGALSLNGVTMIPQGEKFVKAVQSTEAAQQGAAITKLKDGQFPDAEQFVTHVLRLKALKAGDVTQLLQQFTKNPAGGVVAMDPNSQILVLRDYASNIRRMLELIDQVDVPVESDYKLEVIPIKYGKVTDLFDTMNSLISGGGGGGYTTTGARSSTSQRRAGQMGTGGATSPFGTGTTGRYGASRTTGAYGQPQANQPFQGVGGAPGTTPGNASFQQRLNQIVNRAAGASELQLLTDARIVPDERSNSLIVFANKEDMKMITNIVSKVDVLLAQVLIEGVVLSVSLNDQHTLGVSWLQKPVSFGNNSVGTGGINNGPGFLTNITDIASSLPSGFSYFGKLGRNFDVSLSALASDSRTRILQRPRIQTSHATPATFFTGSTVPFVSAVANYAYIGSGTQSSTIEQVQVGVTLNVTPFITPDGLVVMDIDQDISSIDKTVTIDGNPVPQTATRHASATLSVRDGETIMLGGYIEDNRINTKSGVPFLKDIPGLGALFRSKTHNNDRNELLLLMHVTVLKNPADANAQVEAEKGKLPGISDADKEFKKTEEESLKKAGLPTQQR